MYNNNNIKIINQDFLDFNLLEKNSIDLIITSPPYNLDINYKSNKDNLSLKDYFIFNKKWIKKCYNYCKDDGRFCLNVPLDINHTNNYPLSSLFVRACQEVGWEYKTCIIWDKSNKRSGAQWGSWLSASAPSVITQVEMIYVFYKKNWKKTSGSLTSTIGKDDFMEWVKGVWKFPGQNKKTAGNHPAPFPIALPERCIHLFSYLGDTILDPFVGSGSTLLACLKSERKGIGIDIDKSYCDIAINRLRNQGEINQLKFF